MRLEITDGVPPFFKPRCLGCLVYIAISFLAIMVQAAGHRARAERIEREKAVPMRTRRPHEP